MHCTLMSKVQQLQKLNQQPSSTQHTYSPTIYIFQICQLEYLTLVHPSKYSHDLHSLDRNETNL